MADNKPAKPKAKRLVKNPETFRERAIKAGENEAKPNRTSAIKRAGGNLAAPAVGPLKKAASSKPLKPVRFAGRIIFPKYLRNSWQELRKVTWPTWKQSRQLTVAVLIFAVIFGALIALVDYGLDKVFKDILLK